MAIPVNIVLKNVVYNGKPVVQVFFQYYPEIIDRIKRNTKACWSQNLRCWIIQEADFNRQEFVTLFQDTRLIDETGLTLKPEVELPQGYLEKLQQKQYSGSTVKTYCHYFKDFIGAFSDRQIEEISHEEINAYILGLIKEKKISRSQQNQRINAIKFYYEKVLNNKRAYFDIDWPRSEKKLPDVLSKEEVGAMLKATTNLKHKSLIALIYSCGLRRSEAISMKIEDIDSKSEINSIRICRNVTAKCERDTCKFENYK